MTKKTLEPQQARSRESTRKLLKAAAEVLGQHGLEGTTIPRIAQHAGLTPGAVYRRFPDKDALLEAVVIGILERQEQRLRMALTPDMVRQIPLAVYAEQLVSSMLVSYRATPACCVRSGSSRRGAFTRRFVSEPPNWRCAASSTSWSCSCCIGMRSSTPSRRSPYPLP